MALAGPDCWPSVAGGEPTPPVGEVWLDANENPYCWPAEILQSAWESFLARGTHRYPRDGQQLRRALAAYAGVPADWVLPGNGSDELIIAVLSSLGRRVERVVLPWPSFAFYRQAGEALGVPLHILPLAPDFSLPAEDLRRALGQGAENLVILCRPNNPTGNLFGREAVLAALDAGAWVVVDEAYHEFCGETVTDLLARYRRLLVLRTMSKAFALAGLRVGYALAHPKTLALVRAVMQPYGVDSFAQAAALVVLGHVELSRGWVRVLCGERERLLRELQGLPGIRPWPSQANFLLVELLPAAGIPVEEAVAVLARRGVRVRYWPDEPGLRNCFRVTVGRPEENSKFLAELRAALSGPSGRPGGVVGNACLPARGTAEGGP